MSKDFEDQLRGALRPIDPGAGFAQRVLSRIEREPRSPRIPSARFRWLAAAFAASVVLGVVVIHERQLHREQEGLGARKQLIEALRVTGEKLDLAYRVVNSESQPAAADGAGA
jgi:hypothetical protein